MGLLDKLRAEFIDIIEWLDDSRHTLVWRFPRYQNEIKHGAQLIVRPGQMAVFVREGQIADIFTEGRYELTTHNLPVLSTLMGWKYGFDSPFRAEVYFVSTRQITDLKWGTPNPVMLRDPEFGPIRLRAFGTYTLKAVEPKALVHELVGTDQQFEADEINELMRSIINETFIDIIGESKIAALDLAASYRELSDELRKKVVERIDDEYGLDVPQMMIVNISLPEAVEKALDARTSMGMIGDMSRYQQFQMANAMPEAAANPSGGGAAAGMGLGMGMAMAHQMAQTMMPSPMGAMPSAAPSMPPPPPAPTMWHVSTNGQTTGPMAPNQLVAAIQQGQVTALTMVWTQGMAGWAAAGQVPALQPYFSSPPPPPPPVSPEPGK
jgi:membrane protease subunit (stomatin/prohibitin family)